MGLKPQKIVREFFQNRSDPHGKVKKTYVQPAITTQISYE